jgi:hypothetical protein
MLLTKLSFQLFGASIPMEGLVRHLVWVFVDCTLVEQAKHAWLIM